MGKSKRVVDFLRERLYATSFERDSDSYYALQLSEWNEDFEKLMRIDLFSEL